MNQYLNEQNIYQKRLLAIAVTGRRFVVACTEEGCEPCYRGFATYDEAERYAGDCEDAPGEYSHAVYVIEQDACGNWFTTYEDER